MLAVELLLLALIQPVIDQAVLALNPRLQNHVSTWSLTDQEVRCVLEPRRSATITVDQPRPECVPALVDLEPTERQVDLVIVVRQLGFLDFGLVTVLFLRLALRLRLRLGNDFLLFLERVHTDRIAIPEHMYLHASGRDQKLHLLANRIVLGEVFEADRDIQPVLPLPRLGNGREPVEPQVTPFGRSRPEVLAIQHLELGARLDELVICCDRRPSKPRKHHRQPVVTVARETDRVDLDFGEVDALHHVHLGAVGVHAHEVNVLGEVVLVHEDRAETLHVHCAVTRL